MLAYGRVIELKNAIEIRQDGDGLSATQDRELVKLLNECFKVVERRVRHDRKVDRLED